MSETANSILSDRGRELFYKKAARTARSYLRQMRELGNVPVSLAPFMETLEKVFVKMESPFASEKTVGSFCAMVPNELIYAAGAVPVRLCSGSYTAYSISDGLAARDACPLVKAVAGFAASRTMPLYEECSLMIVPVSCDCKKKIAGLLGRTYPTAAVYLPAEKHSDDDTEVFRQELYRLIPQIEQASGKEITLDSLAEAINTVGRAQYEMAKFLQYRKNSPPLIFGTHVMAAMNALAYLRADHWAKHMAALTSELEERLHTGSFAARNTRPRLLLTGSPITFPNIKIPLLIEQMGGIVAADETCLGERAIYDPVSVIDPSFDGMMRALSNRYFAPCTCPVFADNSQRVYRIKQMIKDCRIQGVIYHVLRGCLVYDYEYAVLEEELAAWDIPVIRLESDYNEEDVEQLRIRIEAFIEMIKLREYHQKRK